MKPKPCFAGAALPVEVEYRYSAPATSTRRMRALRGFRSGDAMSREGNLLEKE